MNDPLDLETQLLFSRLERSQRLTYLVILWENASKALWRTLSWICFFAGVWLLSLLSLFELAGHITGNIIFISGLIYLLYKDLKYFKRPTIHEINRRLEKDNAYKHRPLTSAQDTIFDPKKAETRALWQQRGALLNDFLRKFQTPRPKSFTAQQDPYALRLCAIVVLLSGVLVAGPDWPERLGQGVIPYIWEAKDASTSDVIATITAPEYTNLAPIQIERGDEKGKKFEIAYGSTIKISAHSRFSIPYIKSGKRKWTMEELGDNNYMIEMRPPKKEDSLTLKKFLGQNFTLNYTIIADEPPRIERKIREKKIQSADEETDSGNSTDEPLESTPENEQGSTSKNRAKTSAENNREDTRDQQTLPKTVPEIIEPQILSNAQVQIPLMVYDDYGVKTITMEMTLSPMIERQPIGYPQSESRSLMSPAKTEFDIQPIYDFTANPWAGLPVEINLSVKDWRGQKAKLPTIEMTLPERKFEHPIAQKIIEQRKRLAWYPTTQLLTAAKKLEELLAHPEDFQHDTVAYVALRSAVSRLRYAHRFLYDDTARKNKPDTLDAQAVMTLLWNVALRIEDGNLSIAERNLRQAQMALENALNNDTRKYSGEELAELTYKLRQAMAEYFNELAKEMQKQMTEGSETILTPEMLEKLLDLDALGSFMDQMENDLLSGDKKQAQEKLSELQRLLDMLNPNMAAPMPRDMQAMAQGVSELQKLIDSQKDLRTKTKGLSTEERDLDREKTFGDLLEPDKELLKQWGLEDLGLPPPPTGTQSYSLPSELDTSGEMAEQEGLRYILGELMLDADKELQQIPEEMGLAEQEMRGSTKGLGENIPSQSVPHQDKAIEYLEKSQQSLREQLQERMEEMGMGQMAQPQQQQGQRDPLGRPYGQGENKDQSFLPGSKVKIPDEAQRKRVEEILRKLRERSGEFARPQEELEYFRRLLKQF